MYSREEKSDREEANPSLLFDIHSKSCPIMEHDDRKLKRKKFTPFRSVNRS
jgi:hypothetical protein